MMKKRRKTMKKRCQKFFYEQPRFLDACNSVGMGTARGGVGVRGDAVRSYQTFNSKR